MLEEISYPKFLKNDIGGPRKIMQNIKGLGLCKSRVFESLALRFGDLKWSSLINTSSQSYTQNFCQVIFMMVAKIILHE